MSIHVSDRTPSKIQYEDSFKVLYDEMYDKMKRVPNRRVESVAKPLLDAMNKAYDMILRIEEDPIKGTRTAAATRFKRIVEAQRLLKLVEKPLWIYWNICGDREEPEMHERTLKQRMNLCDRFNHVFDLLYDAYTHSVKYQPENDIGKNEMHYYSQSDIRNARFLYILQDLHRMTHSKLLRLDQVSRSAHGAIVRELIDNAWYYAVDANRKRLNIPSEREMRRKEFAAAISALKRMERPLFSIMSTGQFSNRELREWTELFNESIRLLFAIQKSDKKRAG